MQMKNDISKRVDKAKQQEIKYRESPDIVVKVVCRYRADLFFKISRKTKLSRLFNAWTDRMESSSRIADAPPGVNAKLDGSPPPAMPVMDFVFTHNGRAIDADLTPEEAGMEDNDEILAVELMDLTEGAEMDDLVRTEGFVPPTSHSQERFTGRISQATKAKTPERVDR
jgi:hypothetical protein